MIIMANSYFYALLGGEEASGRNVRRAMGARNWIETK